MKIALVISKSLLILGMLFGLTAIQTGITQQMSRFAMNYTLGLVLLNLAPILAYGLIGLLISYGQKVTAKGFWWVVLSLLGLMIGSVIYIVIDPAIFIRHYQTLLEVERVGGLVVGLLVGIRLPNLYLRIQKAE